MSLQHEPAALVLSRLACPTLDRARQASMLLSPTGGEVPLCLDVYERLIAEGVPACVGASVAGNCSHARTKPIESRCPFRMSRVGVLKELQKKFGCTPSRGYPLSPIISNSFGRPRSAMGSSGLS